MTCVKLPPPPAPPPVLPAAFAGEPSGSERLSDRGHYDFAQNDVDPAVWGGGPTKKGTRMRVSDILEAIASGAGEKELVEISPTSPQRMSARRFATPQPRKVDPGSSPG